MHSLAGRSASTEIYCTAWNAGHYPPETCEFQEIMGDGIFTSASPGGTVVTCQQALPGYFAAGMSAISQPDSGNILATPLLWQGKRGTVVRVDGGVWVEEGEGSKMRNKLRHMWESVEVVINNANPSCS